MESQTTQKSHLSNPEIRASAYAQLKGNWGTPIVASIVYFVIVNAIAYIPIPGTSIHPSFLTDPVWTEGFQIPILGTLLGGAFTIGFYFFYLNIARKRKADIANLFEGFKQILQAMIASFLILLITIVGFALLIIPGIIAALGLSQTYFIMADKPGISATDAMKESWEIMKGHKTDFFALQWSFIGWILLALIFTLGIGMLWVTPYMYLSYAHFYMNLRGEDGELQLEDHLVV